MRDIVHNLSITSAIAPAVQAATIKGAAIDLAGFDSVMFAVNTGAIASAGNFTATVQESDTTTDGDFTDVPAARLQGSAIANPLTADGTFKIGYRGHKRYCRIVLTKNSGTSIAAGAIAIRGHAADKPVA